MREITRANDRLIKWRRMCIPIKGSYCQDYNENLNINIGGLAKGKLYRCSCITDRWDSKGNCGQYHS